VGQRLDCLPTAYPYPPPSRTLAPGGPSPRSLVRLLLRQLTRFGMVGAVGLVLDVAIFNLLRTTVLAPEELHEGPVLAKVISTAVAILANWIGNRYWTFGDSRRTRALREGLEFLLVSVGGMLIGLGCLWLSHYVLGFTSLLADNISTNVVGLALGTAFRFTLYKWWVFAPHRAAIPAALHGPASAERSAVLPGRGAVAES
jgi:putative flippase GtrA